MWIIRSQEVRKVATMNAQAPLSSLAKGLRTNLMPKSISLMQLQLIPNLNILGGLAIMRHKFNRKKWAISSTETIRIDN